MNSIFPGIPHIESPLFNTLVDELDLNDAERQVAIELHDRGYAVIDFPDDEIDCRIERIKTGLAPRFGIDFDDSSVPKNTGENQRLQDAWLVNEDVRAIAANQHILDLLRKLYGRRAFPFQTLNFPVGTQQGLHSDSNHFSSIPERFMCGVWLAMEDVHADAGPLMYLPGSHRWPIITNLMIGRHAFGAQPQSAQSPFEEAWNAMAEASQVQPEMFFARKGQALIWAANLLHGGSPQSDPTRTRWSQVSHYYFEDCIYYTPAYSDDAIGRLDLRNITNIMTGEIERNKYLGNEFAPAASEDRKARRRWWQSRLNSAELLPKDFDPETYLYLNPDVAGSHADPVRHYLTHGAREGRRFRRG